MKRILAFIIAAFMTVMTGCGSTAPVEDNKRDTDNDATANIGSSVVETGDIEGDKTDTNGETVSVYHYCQKGQEDEALVKLLSELAESDDNILLTYIDAVVYPDFGKQYTDKMDNNSVLVVGPNRARVVDYIDMYQYIVEGQYLSYEEYYQYNQQFNMYYGTSPSYELYFSADQLITSAIDYVTGDVIPVVYYTTKHGEMMIDSDYTKNIANVNVDLRELDFGENTVIPHDASVLLINAPTIDFTEEETKSLLTFMQRGGNVILLTNFESEVNKNLPNIASMCNSFGLTAVDGLLTEENSALYLQSQFNTIPTINNNSDFTDISDDIDEMIVVSLAHGITVDDSAILTPIPILTSSDNAVIVNNKPDGDTSDDEFIKEEGKFHSSVLVSVPGKNESDNGNFVWYSTNYLFTNGSPYASSIGTDNSRLFVNTLEFLCNN